MFNDFMHNFYPCPPNPELGENVTNYSNKITVVLRCQKKKKERKKDQLFLLKINQFSFPEQLSEHITITYQRLTMAH